MTDWICPNCRGGFPDPESNSMDQIKCPWCGQSISGQYEYEPEVRIAKSDDETEQGGFLEWLR